MSSGRPLVTVSIPTYRTGPLLRRAVESVLAQTEKRIRVVVTNDGGPPDDLDVLDGIDDPRLVLANAPRNLGRYAVDRSVSETFRSTWFAICDSDDWVEPYWLESMLEASAAADVVAAPHYWHNYPGARPRILSLRRYDGSYKWHGHLGAALYRRTWLHETRALSGALRVGYDNVITGLSHLVGRRVEIGTPTYHREVRPNSLVTSTTTGLRSDLRRDTGYLLERLWGDLRARPDRARSIIGSLEMERTAAETIRAIVAASWAMSRDALEELDALVWRESPRRIIEFGSGASTVVLGRYARLTGADVLSIEHDPTYQRKTRGLLASAGLVGSVDLRLCPLEGEPPFYRVDLPSDVDLVVVDGPPDSTGGRQRALDFALPRLRPGWLVWLDDAHRPTERAILAGARESGLHVEESRLGHSPALIRERPGRHRVEAGDTVVGILTGHRPDLLERTLSSLPPGLLETAYVVALHDGGDRATSRILERYADRIDHLEERVHPSAKMYTIGENWSRLVDLCRDRGRYLLMLEDDWEFSTFDHEWLTRARVALDDPTIAQVRLRHHAEPVLERHMATGRRIVWEPHEHGFGGHAHLTFQANLTRTEDLGRWWPAVGERDAQKKALEAGLRYVVQLYPGAFHHIGERSLREELRPPH